MTKIKKLVPKEPEQEEWVVGEAINFRTTYTRTLPRSGYIDIGGTYPDNCRVVEPKTKVREGYVEANIPPPKRRKRGYNPRTTFVPPKKEVFEIDAGVFGGIEPLRVRIEGDMPMQTATGARVMSQGTGTVI